MCSLTDDWSCVRGSRRQIIHDVQKHRKRQQHSHAQRYFLFRVRRKPVHLQRLPELKLFPDITKYWKHFCEFFLLTKYFFNCVTHTHLCNYITDNIQLTLDDWADTLSTAFARCTKCNNLYSPIRPYSGYQSPYRSIIDPCCWHLCAD